jgi:polyhydroxybutyrate depolymerase
MKTQSFITLATFVLAAAPLVACSDTLPGEDGGGGSGPVGVAGATSASGSGGGGGGAGFPAATGGAGSSGVAGSLAGGGTASGGSPSGGSGGSGGAAGAAGSSEGGAGGLGSSGAAGAGGNGGAAGAATGGTGGGGAGGSGGGGGGKLDAKKSKGCGMSTTQKLGSFVESMVMSGGSNRPYAVSLPTGYDPMRAYPVVVLLHGCGSGTNNVNMGASTGADAILIRGTGSGADTCWDTKANGPDVTFFDAMVADTKARFCTDENRFFAVGYSSGSWFANQLTCIRSDVLRGAGTVTGGESSNGQCGGPVARIFIHDQDDTTNVISGSVRARDRQLTQNMCDKTAQPMAVSPSPCVAYQGCAAGNPVHWCQTMGQKHNRQDNVAGPAFWNFFKAL